jgi:hypothetical protein
LLAAAEHYAMDTRRRDLRRAIDSVEMLLRVERAFQAELSLKHSPGSER